MKKLALTLFALVLAVAACDDEGAGFDPIEGPVDESNANDVVSTRLCAIFSQCHCGELAGVQLTGCDFWLDMVWADKVDEAAAKGWTYDGDCVAARMNAIQERGCDTGTPAIPGCQGETCQVYYGASAEGEPCDGSLSASDCAQGLVCLGTCMQPCAGQTVDLVAGAACLDDSGMIGTCAQGLVCDPASRTCRALPTAGETCLSATCDPSAWCDTSDIPAVCREPRANGEPCIVDLMCAGGFCALGQCAQLPGAGELCHINPLRPCQDGLGCNLGTCVELPGENAPCLPPTTLTRCGEGLVCGAKLCDALSSSVPECAACPAGEMCFGTVCTRQPPLVCGDMGGLVY